MTLLQIFYSILLVGLSTTNSIEHKVIKTTRTAYGFETTLKLGDAMTDTYDSVFEILHADSTISFMVPVWPTQQLYAKLSDYTAVFFVTDDTLSTLDRVVPKGTYASYYPQSETCSGKASIAFYASLQPDNREGFLLPDLKLESGVLYPGDTVSMTDHLGNTSRCRIESMEITNDNNARVALPFLVPQFCKPNSSVSVLYSVISGSPMTEKISVQKNK